MIYLFRWLIVPLFCFCSGYGQPISPSDIIINEVLFNPAKDGYDYVEGFNRSSKSIDLSQVLIGNRNVTKDISALKSLSKKQLYIQPGEHFVITANEKWMKQNYSVALTARICEISSPPSFPDDEGTVIFLNKEDSSIIDELNYSEKWHFPLINDPSGVSIERISYESPTQDKNNWTSASSSCGYGSPGSQNSQFRMYPQAEGEVIVSPQIFSPDNDGSNDFAFIVFNMKEPGYVANLTIYDLSGRRIRYLIKNEVLGASSRYKWDGMDDLSQKAPTGLYIVFTEIFNLNGRVRKFKNVIALNNLKN